MQPKLTQPGAEVTHVTLLPDEEGGIAVANFGSDRYAGNEVRLSGIHQDDVDAINTGANPTVLDQYVQVDPELPHVYRIVNCAAALIIGQAHTVGITNFAEFAPHPHVAEG